MQNYFSVVWWKIISLPLKKVKQYSVVLGKKKKTKQKKPTKPNQPTTPLPLPKNKKTPTKKTNKQTLKSSEESKVMEHNYGK